MLMPFFRGAVLSLCFVSAAQAGVLLERIEAPFFGPPSILLNKKCTVNVNEANPLIKDKGQLIKQYQIDGMLTKEVTSMQLSVAAIRQKIDQAATGKKTVKPTVFDGPVISYKAYQQTAAGAVKTILLYETNGYNAKETLNDSPAAQTLITLINANCQ